MARTKTDLATTVFFVPANPWLSSYVPRPFDARAHIRRQNKSAAFIAWVHEVVRAADTLYAQLCVRAKEKVGVGAEN